MKRVFLSVACLVMAYAVHAEQSFKAVINDIVTAKVVSVKITSGTVPASGTVLVVKRKDTEVAKLKLRTPSGICNVLSGSVKKGDLVFIDTTKAVVGNETPAAAENDDSSKAFATYSNKDDIEDPSLRALLEAEGYLITARHVATLKADDLSKPLAEQVAKSQETLKRIAVAKSVMALESPGQRVSAELRSAGNMVLANTVSGEMGKPAVQPAPILPSMAKTFTLNPYGEASLISKDLSLWKTPQYWGQKPIDPNFSGWTVNDNEVIVSANSDALIRADLLLGDVEMTGKVQIESGTSLFVILRNEVVVKFIHEAADCGVAVKAGYNNLRFITNKGTCKPLERKRWYQFRVTMAGEQLQVFLDKKKVLECGIHLTGDDQVKLPELGYLGLGAYYGNGRFKDVQVRALSPSGKTAVPIFKRDRVYKKAGALVEILDGKQEYACIYGTKVQSHRRIHHAVADGTLKFSGSPFAQFTTKSLTKDNYRVSGKLRIMEEGNVWFRMNEKLLFGVSAMKPREDRDEGEYAYYVKYRWSNFLSYDHGFAGTPLRPETWYEWELEYTHPAAVLKINGRQVALARCPKAEAPEPGWNHFGISAFNVKAEFTNLAYQPLALQQAELPTDEALLAEFTKADTALKSFERTVTGAGAGKASALAVLQGKRQPVIADSEDFKAVAETFRQQHNWPVYLSLLEANYRRFAEKSDERKAAEGVWRLARQKFDIAQETLEPGDLGLDNIVRLDKPAAPMASAQTNGVWYYLEGAKKIQLLEPADRHVKRSLVWPHPLSRVLDRGGYLLVLSKDKKTIWKVDVGSGEELGKVAIPNGQVLDWVATVGQTSFVSVDENAVNEQIFMKYVIYALNEETMALYNSGGFGQMLAVDPFGRYLYSGIMIQADRSIEQMDPSPLRPAPQGMTMDHLMCFSISNQDLSLISDRSAPGLLGKALAVVPSGRYVCYVAERGFKRDANNALTGDKVAGFRAAQVSRTLNSFDCGGRPTMMAFNPVKPVAYIYNGTQVRSFHSVTFEPISIYKLPGAAVTGSGTALTVDGSGRYIYFAYSGKPGGIAVFDTLEKEGISSNQSPQKALANAEDLMKQGKTKDAVAALQPVMETVLFSELGEKAVELLLMIEDRLPADAPAMAKEPFEVVQFDKTEVPQELVTPPKPEESCLRPVLKKEYQETLEELASFRNLAKEFPWSWRYVCAEALKKQPDNAEILLLMAESAEDAGGSPFRALGFAKQLLTKADKKGYYAVKAYSLMAELTDDIQYKLYLLEQAKTLNPRNPFLHKRLGDALLKAGNKAYGNYHLRMALHLFPSQRELSKTLVAAGYPVPQPSAEEREIDELYKALAPSAVMIRHSAGVGTGFFITRDGMLLTNHHVIGDNATTWTVHITDAAGTKHKLPARFVASDARLDIAILSVDLGPIVVEPMILASPDFAKTGMRTIAIGNPGMGAEVLARTVTEGIISNVSQRVGGQYYIQTSAAVNPGNSGGPLLSRHGVVLGMVTLKASLDNVGFAIPTDRLFKFLEDNLN